MSKKAMTIIGIILVFVLGSGAGYLVSHRMHSKTAVMSMPGVKNHEGHGEAKAAKELYTCPMHPFIITEEPGACPICGMTLVAVKGDSEGSANEENAIRIDSVVRQNMGVRTGIPKQGPLSKTIRTVGMVSYDERRIASVNTKVAGWIEKLYVNETGQFVKKGEPLLEIYSPELLSAQKELLVALKHYEEVKESPFENVVLSAKALIEASRERLRLWDISDQELENLMNNGAVKKTLVIYSPSSGVVVLKKAFEGSHVKPGMELYRVADISTLWVDADVYEFELPWVKVGQGATVRLDYIPGRTFKGRVSYIYPYLDEKTKTAKVRVDIPNADYALKPEMYAHVAIESRISKETLTIPSEAVIRTGVRNVVFVEKEKGTFVPREVSLGINTGNGTVQVLSGLTKEDKIVLSGQFMLDSESSIREAIRKMTSGGADGSMGAMEHMGHQH